MTNHGSSIINLNRKTIILGAILVTVAIFLLNPTSSDQLVEGKKAKKAIKSIVKGLVLQSLSTRKNFLPLPVPIPGKWQKFLSTMIDSGVLDNSSLSSKKMNNLKYKAANLDGKRASFLLTASNLVDSLSRAKKIKASSVSSSSSSDSALSPMDVNNIKKLTRLAAATYAGRLISIGAPGTLSSSTSSLTPTTTNKLKSSTLVQKASSASSDSGSKRNDVLVTAFNVVKLAQQIRELDPSKLLNISKKTSLSSSSSGARFPLVSMNINNRKTFMNKMHYIHKLTYDLNHRHRNNNKNMLANA